MKIGLVLFGHLRSFRSTHESFLELKKIFEHQGEVDVFCHTWDIEESVSATWWKNHNENELPQATVQKDELISRYQPTAYFIEPSKQFEEPDLGIKCLIPLPGMISMLYSQLKAFELLKEYESKTGVKYDVIIKTRYDLLYEIAPDLASVAEQTILNDCLYLPSSNPYELAGAFSDIFALGPHHLIEKYFDFNKDLRAAVEFYKEQGYTELIPELLMRVFLYKKNITVREITGLRIHILRMSGDKFQINTCKDFNENFPLCFYSVTADKCRQLLANNLSVLNKNETQAVKKYIGWVDKTANEEQLESYAEFKKGEWLPLKKTIRLATLAKQSKIFTANVIRDFFEAAIMNAKYGLTKMLLQATALAANGYGVYFFKVIRKKLMN